MIQWLGFYTSSAGSISSIPSQGTNTIIHAMQCGQRKEKEKKYFLEFSFHMYSKKLIGDSN